MSDRKQKLISGLRAFVASKPGFDPYNYDDAASYRCDMRRATKQRHDAERLIDAAAWRDSMSADDILGAAKHAFSGRLEITETDTGFRILYCAGQYYPTEYRAAVAAVMASAFWDYWRGDDVRYNGDDIRVIARREFGTTFANRWFR